MKTLPGILGDIEEVVGLQAALQIARGRGGTDLSLSNRAGSLLVELIGQDLADKLVAALGKGVYTIPMAGVRGQRARRAAVARMLAEGVKSEAEVALAADVHQRTVRRVRANPPQPPKLPLFDD